MDRAERWIGLSDGGAGLEDWLRANFRRLDAVILDFYHAAEYLGDLARALHPGDEAARAAWLGDWCHRLKHEGGAAVLAADLQALEVRGGAAQAAWRGRRVLRQPGAPDGLPELRGQGLADRLGPGGGGVQDGRRPAAEGLGDAAGVPTGPTRCATCGLCSRAGTASGTPSGAPPPN